MSGPETDGPAGLSPAGPDSTGAHLAGPGPAGTHQGASQVDQNRSGAPDVSASGTGAAGSGSVPRSGADLEPGLDPTVADLPPTGLPSVPGVQLIERIGRGGFATVYRAHQLSVDRDVAVKLDDRRLLDARDQRRFTREIIAAGSVSAHPHIVTLYDGGTAAGGHPYLVMELYTGGSYSDRMRGIGPIPPAEVAEVGFAIADALVAAHSEGILHRDGQPGNILISRYGTPALTDFGLATLPRAGEGFSVTMDSLTPSYAAPEAFGGAEPTVAMDLYALGATLYAMLLGRAPRSDTSGTTPPIAKLLLLLNDPLPDPHIPGAEPLMRVIWRATATEPADRYPSAAAMRDDLAAVRAGRLPSAGVMPFAATPPHKASPDHAGPGRPGRDGEPSVGTGTVAQLPDLPPAPPRSGRVWLIAALVALVALVAGGIGLVVANRGAVAGEATVAAQEPGGGSSVATRTTPPRTSATEKATETSQTSSTHTGPTPTTDTLKSTDTAKSTGTTPTTAGTTGTTVGEVKAPLVGSCFNGIITIGDQVTAGRVASCAQPHYWEAYATGLLDPATATPYMTDVSADPVVNRMCNKPSLQRYLGAGHSGTYEVRVIPPTEVAFAAGDKGFYCVAQIKGAGKVTGSLKDAG